VYLRCMWCVQLFEDVVSVLDPEMLDQGRSSSDDLTASYSDVHVMCTWVYMRCI